MNDCFLDVNILIYLIDESSSFHRRVKTLMIQFEKNNTQLYISHLILAEFIHVFSNLLRLVKEKNIYGSLEIAIEKIASIPNITIVSPPEDFIFTNSVVKIMKTDKLKSNDAYLLSTLKHHTISYLATFDRVLIKAATKLHIKTAS